MLGELPAAGMRGSMDTADERIERVQQVVESGAGGMRPFNSRRASGHAPAGMSPQRAHLFEIGIGPGVA